MNHYPLSRSQWSLWYQQATDPDDNALNVALAARLSAPAEAAVLVQALHRVLERHEVLRSVIELDSQGRLRQRPLDPPTSQVTLVDFSSEDISTAEVLTLQAHAAERPFDLEVEPPLRATVVRSPSDRGLAVLVTVHHSCWDAASTTIFWRELGAEAASMPSRPPQYHEYAELEAHAELRERQASALRHAVRHYDSWHPAASGSPVAAALSQPVGFELDDPINARRLDEGGSSVFAVLVATAARAWFAVTGRQSLRFAFDVSLRAELARFDDTIGLFQNQVVVRLDQADEQGLLEAAQLCVLEGLESRWAPYDELVRRSGWSGMVDRDPFDAKISFERVAAGQIGPFVPVVRTVGFPRHDLTFGFTVRPDGSIGCSLTTRLAEYQEHLPLLRDEMLVGAHLVAGALV